MVDEQLVWLKKATLEIKQNNLNLSKTRQIVEMYRFAKNRGLDDRITQEFYLLIHAAAKYEWGEETTVDDFMIEGKFVIRKGLREDVL